VLEQGREITAGYGVRLTCHHEFFCGIQSEPDIETFYSYTDPQYVSLFVDTAQHCIAGLDPVALYRRHAHRVSGFHFKDTRNVATGDDHRHRPDSEIMAPTTGKWFYEMGTPHGLVDFEAMMTAVRDTDYRGWISVEHDKANKQGGDYSESTAVARWYAAERPGTDLLVSGIRWGYAINQWKPQFDDFVRREQHERALKTISIAGFEGVELTAGTGRLGAAGQPAAAGRQLRLGRRLPRSSCPELRDRRGQQPGTGTRRSVDGAPHRPASPRCRPTRRTRHCSG
jgi:hypothetical protein